MNILKLGFFYPSFFCYITTESKNKYMNWFQRLFCKHTYELVNQMEMKSEYDIVIESGKTPNTHLSMKRKIITDYRCTECGQIKRLTATH